MKSVFLAEKAHEGGSLDEAVGREIERANARLRHFRGIAATVMGEAFLVWREIVEIVEDPRSCRDLLENFGNTSACVPSSEERTILLEKLHLLGIQIDYARRLCEGQIGNDLREKGVF